MIILKPEVLFVFVGEFGCQIAKCSPALFVDGTFDLCEEGLVLTTVLGIYEDYVLPCASMLSECRTTETYETMWKCLFAETGGKMDPEGGVMDFEEALGTSFLKVFPHASVWRDLFHWLRALARKMTSLNFSEEEKKYYKQRFTSLWASEDKTEFEQNLEEILNEIQRRSDVFCSYFKNEWCKVHPPETWAAYGRPSNAPSGQGVSEGYNSRLQNVVFKNTSRQTIDFIAEKLQEEDDYFARVTLEPALAKEKLRELTISRSRPSRKSLKNYIPNPSQPTLSTSTCVNCKEKKKNQSCEHGMCLGCCKTKSRSCSGHRLYSVVNEQVKNIIDEAMHTKDTIWVVYKGGSHGDKWRGIKNIKSHPFKPQVYCGICCIDNIEKEFCYSKTLEATTENPEPEVEGSDPDCQIIEPKRKVKYTKKKIVYEADTDSENDKSGKQPIEVEESWEQNPFWEEDYPSRELPENVVLDGPNMMTVYPRYPQKAEVEEVPKEPKERKWYSYFKWK
jgi:hypothetical protein